MRGRLVEILGALAVGVTYVLTSSRHLLGGDAGELAAGGVLHPPGYPLFSLVQRAFAWLPASSPTHRAALVTALVATLSVAALGWAARAWGASRASASFVSLLYAFGPLAWDLGTHAEVFTLNVLVAMGIVGLSADRAPRGSETLRAVLLALLAGLGLSNHHSIVLLAPLGLYAFGRAVKRSGAPAVVFSAGALVLGLLPYSLLVIAARSTKVGDGCIWGDPRTLRGLVDHFLRKEYGTTQLGISSAPLEPFAHVFALLTQLVSDLPGSLVVLAMGAVVGARTQTKKSVPLLVLSASLLLAGPLFVARFNLPASGVAVLVTERFHLLPLALVALLLALAIDACARALQAERGDPSPRFRRIMVGVAALAVLGRAAASFPELRERQRPTIDLWLGNVMTLLPPDAIVLHSGDHRVGAFMYARCARHERPDVVAIAPQLLLTSWYPPEVSAELGLEVVRGELRPGAAAPSLASRALVEQLLATGRPVFVTNAFAPAVASLPSYPIGPLLRIVASPSELPPLAVLIAQNEAAFAVMHIEETPPAADTWAAFPATDYARTWHILAQAAGGDATLEARAKALEPRVE